MKQFLILLATASCLLAAEKPRTPLDPRGKVHIPIGVANTLDTLKTFVEAEGNFSPGFGSYGLYFWVRDEKAGRLYAPTMQDVKSEHGLMPGGLLKEFRSSDFADLLAYLKSLGGTFPPPATTAR